MRSIIRVTGTAAAAMVFALGGVNVAAATESAAFAPTVTCQYTVIDNHTPVHENPSPDSVVRKYKNAGDIVGGPCVTANGGGDTFAAVSCSCATDGIGWIWLGHLA